MARENDAPLDLRMYLAKARGGTTKDYRKKATVFSQGSPADAVFYIEKGKVKLTVLSTRGKEAVVAHSSPMCIRDTDAISRQPGRSETGASSIGTRGNRHSRL